MQPAAIILASAINCQRGSIVTYSLRTTALLAMMATSLAALANGDSIAEAVQNATYYSWGAVGTPAVESSGELAARVLARDHSPGEVIKLIPDARPEGKLYLLCIMRKIAPQDYAKAKALAGFTNETKVSTFTGNVLTLESASAVLQQIETSNCGAMKWAAGKGREK